jgi:hypothetical protein
MNSIAEKLDDLSGRLSPLREAVTRYLKYPSVLAEDGVISVGHRPWVAELNYMFTLYPGIERASLDRYGQRFGIEIPEIYAEVLGELNGAFCFGVSLCGVPRSMLGTPPLLDRTILQCHDLGTAATMWAREYRVPDGLFHFGGRHFSSRAIVGYFLDRETKILCLKNSGKVVGEWSDFAEFLGDELKSSEELESKLHPWR